MNLKQWIKDNQVLSGVLLGILILLVANANNPGNQSLQGVFTSNLLFAGITLNIMGYAMLLVGLFGAGMGWGIPLIIGGFMTIFFGSGILEIKDILSQYGNMILIGIGILVAFMFLRRKNG